MNSVNQKFKVIQRSKSLFFNHFCCYFYTFWPSYDLHFFTFTFHVFLSLTNDLSLIRYPNYKVTSTRNPTIHIHINKNPWKLLIHFPAFSFFKSHNFFSQVGPDNKITHARCSKPLNIIQNKILVFILTTSNTVWSVLNQMCTLLHLFLPENHAFFKNSRKNSKNWQKPKPFKIYRRKWF